jgi:RNA polymerase sigma-70 factor (ECF subfamily)
MVPDSDSGRGSGSSRDSDEDLLDRLIAGDEQAFVVLVRRHHAAMVGLATSFVPNRAVAEEVVQDTWLAVLRGLDGFQRRSSLRSWLFSILVNRAKASGARERRSVPVEDPGPAVEASRFDSAGHWQSPPEQWLEAAADRQRAAKIADRIRTAVQDLPPGQRDVVTLRDIEGLSSDQVCQLLGITAGNQRVLLHRGRGRLRQMIETEFGGAR